MNDKRVKRTVEESIKVVVIDFTQFHKVLTKLGTCIDLKIDDYVTERCFHEKRHPRARSNGFQPVSSRRMKRRSKIGSVLLTSSRNLRERRGANPDGRVV